MPNAQKAYAHASGEINILWSVPGGDAEQGPESGMPGAAAVEAEDELVEVGLQMPAAQAVVDAQALDLEVGEDTVRPGQHDIGGHLADNMGIVADAGNTGVSRPAVGLGGRPRGEVLGDEGMQTVDAISRRGYPRELVAIEKWFQSDGSAFANANRLVAKVGSTALQDGMGIRPRSGTENTIRSTLYAVCRGDGVSGAHHALERPVSPTYLSPIVR